MEVNQGSHDPPELAALMVKVVLEHEAISFCVFVQWDMCAYIGDQ